MMKNDSNDIIFVRDNYIYNEQIKLLSLNNYKL